MISTTIKTNKQANEMIQLIKKVQPKIGAFDTETTGLHIHLDKPFLYQFGFLHPETEEIYTYVVDIEKQPDLTTQVVNVWQNYAQNLDLYLGHNIKFDLHMMTNIGLPYQTENLSDTMFYIRHAHDALAPEKGGPPLGLKEYSTRYIDPNAKYLEKTLKSEQSARAKEYNKQLAVAIKKINSKYTLKFLDEIFKDPILEIEDLPPDIKEAYKEWHSTLPLYLQNKVVARVESDFIAYNTLNRENIIHYGHYDIYYTLQVYLKTLPIITARQTQNGIEIENKLILPIYEMERVGFATDKNYLETCKIQMKEYITQQRKTFYTASQSVLKIGQHAKIKETFEQLFQIGLNSTNSDELSQLKSNLIREQANPEAIQYIDLLQELRTLEKWYSTYIVRFLTELKNTERLYTTINQVGTVSGRVTSGFQQFPKEAITTHDGIELFNPRKMITTTGGEYNAIIYLDYSQIELRLQAFYTILVRNPDLNLCRAYMPYQCINEEGVEFDHTNMDHIKAWGKVWFLREEPSKVWTPTDVHGATTEYATGLTPSDPAFAKLRSSIGKRTNFAKNYGAKLNKIKQMFPEKTEEEARRIDNAYYLAFPGIKAYQTYCYRRAEEFAYTENLFGVKYYNVNGHNLINMLVQGSAAYLLKWKIREAYDFLKENNLKSRFQMNIHDELSWEVSDQDDPAIFFKLKELLEYWDATYVPIVADMEATKTTWADKKEMETIDELRLYLRD
jgi:DNA polymerase-1